MKRIAWIVLVMGAIGIGFYPMVYWFVDTKFGFLNLKEDVLLRNMVWKTGFYTHITLGGLALLAGWPQFMTQFRNRRLNLHRWLGKVYVVAVLLSAVAGIYIGWYATGGVMAQTGFICLGIIWFTTTGAAYVQIRNGRLLLHQKWMIYSYAACLAAVTLRLWLPLLILVFHDFVTAYQIVAWLCWVPNVLVAWYLVQKNLSSDRYPASIVPAASDKEKN